MNITFDGTSIVMAFIDKMNPQDAIKFGYYFAGILFCGYIIKLDYDFKKEKLKFA